MEYCKCEKLKSIHTIQEEWGIWDVCDACNKKIEDSYRSYNHYDGEDHIYCEY